MSLDNLVHLKAAEIGVHYSIVCRHPKTCIMGLTVLCLTSVTSRSLVFRCEVAVVEHIKIMSSHIMMPVS